MRLAIFALAMALQAQMELGAEEDCCLQGMVKPLDGFDAVYSSLPSDQQAFISEFNITGYNTENYPNYQAGDFCITWGDGGSKGVGWVISNCQSGMEIAFAGNDPNVPNCLEGYDNFFFYEIADYIFFEFVCVTESTESGEAASDTTKVITTEPEHLMPKDTGAPVAPSTTTEAPTTQEHVETTKDTGAPVAPSTTTEASTTQEHVETTKKPCEPCRDVLEGDLAGYYELQSEDDPRCDDGCSYTNQHSQEFCFRPGGFETKLECHDPQ